MIVLDCQRVFQSHFKILKFFTYFHVVSSKIFVMLYNKSLNNWSQGKHFILFPENLNVSRGGVFID